VVNNQSLNTDHLRNSNKTFTIERKDDYSSLPLVDYIDVFGSVEEYEQALADQAAARAEEEAMAEEMTRKCYNHQADWHNIQVLLWNRIAVIGNKRTKRQRQEEAGNLNDIKGWISKQTALKNNFQNDNCSIYVTGPVKELSKSSYGYLTLGQLDAKGYRTSVSTGGATYTITGTDMTIGLNFVRNIINNGL